MNEGRQLRSDKKTVTKCNHIFLLSIYRPELAMFQLILNIARNDIINCKP